MQTPSFTLRTILKVMLIGSLSIIFVTYILYQSRLLLTGPVVTLTNEPTQTQTERTITLTGTAENITIITLNGRPIVTTQTGQFTESVVLENGYTSVRIHAQDRYGRKTNIDRIFIYTPVEN